MQQERHQDVCHVWPGTQVLDISNGLEGSQSLHQAEFQWDLYCLHGDCLGGCREQATNQVLQSLQIISSIGTLQEQ